TEGFWSVLVKPLGPLQAKLPLPLPWSCTLVTRQERVPPAACAPGSSLSMSTSVVAVLVHPLLPVTTKVYVLASLTEGGWFVLLKPLGPLHAKLPLPLPWST